MRIHTCAYTHANTHTCAYTHTHTHTQTHNKRTHIHTHTHTHQEAVEAWQAALTCATPGTDVQLMLNVSAALSRCGCCPTATIAAAAPTTAASISAAPTTVASTGAAVQRSKHATAPADPAASVSDDSHVNRSCSAAIQTRNSTSRPSCIGKYKPAQRRGALVLMIFVSRQSGTLKHMHSHALTCTHTCTLACKHVSIHISTCTTCTHTHTQRQS